MQLDFEERILLNPAFCAILVWHFTRSFFNAKGAPAGLAHVAVAVPMTLHRPTVRKIRRMRLSSGLLNAVAANAEIAEGLQQRAQELLPCVLTAVAAAVASGLVRVHRAPGRLPELIPLCTRDIKALDPAADSARDMTSSARRLGTWFGGMPMNEVATLLRVRF